jgi:adenylate cyclase
VCLSEDAYGQVREKLEHEFVDLGQKALKNIARPIGVYALKLGSESAAPAPSAPDTRGRRPSPSWSFPSPIWAAIPNRTISSTA